MAGFLLLVPAELPRCLSEEKAGAVSSALGSPHLFLGLLLSSAALERCGHAPGKTCASKYQLSQEVLSFFLLQVGTARAAQW